MGDAQGIRAGDAYVAIGADDRGLNRALNNIAGKLRGMGSVVSGVGTRMVGLGAAITAPLAMAAITSANAGAALYDMSRRTGISAAALSSLGFAASLTGTDMETLEGSIRKMQKTIAGMDDVHEGTSAKAIEEIGIQSEALKGLAPDEQFRTIATAIAAIHDPTLRAAETMKIFGKSGTAIIPMIEDLAELEGYAKRMGFVKSNESAKEAKELSVALQLAERAMRSLWTAAGSAVMPILKEEAAVMFKAAGVVRGWIKEHKEGIATAFKIGLALTAVGTGLVVAGKAIGLLGTGFSLVSGALGVFRPLLSGAVGLLGSAVTVATALPVVLGGIAGYLIYLSGVGKGSLGALAAYFGGLKDTAVEAFGGIKDALVANDWKLAAEIAWAGLKLAWQQGILPLKIAWIDMKRTVLETWVTIGDGMVQISVRSIAFLKNIWASFKAWFANLTTDFGDSMVGALVDAQAAIGLISPKEAADRRRNLGQVNQAGHDMNDAERDAALEANEKFRQESMDAIRQLHEAQMDNIAAETSEQLAETQKVLDAKVKALEELTRKAKLEAVKSKVDRESLFPTVRDLTDGPKGLDPDELDRTMKEVKSHASTMGTFNPRAAFGLGGASSQLDMLKQIKGVAGSIVRFAKETAENTRKANSLFP